MLIVGDAGVRVRPVADKFASEADADISRDMPGVAKKAAGFFAAAFAAVKIGGFLKDSISEAVDLGENASKVGVVFGDMAGEVEAFASTASSALGQSRNQALEAAGSFGSLFVSMGLGKKPAADMSTDLVTLASDMASFGNATPQEALDALRSGLIGESEPLRRFGVMLNAASIEAKAVELGLMDVGGELTDAAKAQAVYALAMEQTSIQQGDFARTSEGLANQQRIMGAQFTDLQTNIGGLFVPVLANAAGMLTGTLLPALLTATSGLAGVGDSLGMAGDIARLGFTDGLDAAFAAMDGVEGIARWVLVLAANLGDLSAVFREAFVDGAANSALLGEAGLLGFAVTAGDAAFRIREGFSGVWDGLMEGLAPVLGPLMATVGAAFSTIGATIGAAFGGAGGGGTSGLTSFADMLVGLATTVLPLVMDYFTRWAEVIQAVIPIVVTVLQGLLPVVVDVFGQIGPVLQSLMPIVAQVAGVFATTLLTVIQALAPVIPPLVAAIGQVVSILAGAFLGVLTSLAPVLPVLVQAIGQIAQVLAGAFASALQAILPVLPVIARVIGQVATMLAGALAGALQAVIPILPPLVAALAQIATVLIGALMGALQAILPVIPQLVQVFILLIQSAVVPLLPILPLLANLLATIIAALAPLIPVVIEVVVLLIRLAVAALMPLMPVILVVANLITMLISVLVPIIQVVVTIAGAFIGFAATVISVVVGFVGTVVSVWTGLIGTVTNIFGSIFGVIRGVFSSIAGWVSGIVSSIAGSISGAFSGVVGAISSVFSGIGGVVEGAFSSVTGIIKGAVNGAIGLINNGIAFINDNLIANANKVPLVNIPRIPNVPKLHEGGTFWSNSTAGEGLALLRDGETVVTPEDRDRAAALVVAAAITPRTSTSSTAAASAGITVQNIVNAHEGQSAGEIGAVVSRDTVWALGTSATRQVPVAAGAAK